MEMKINRDIFLKAIALLLCFYIAIAPFFQPKKVNANPVVLAVGAIYAGVLAGMAALGYTHYSSLTPEQMNDLNDKATANLKEAYPNATDYDNQVNIIYNLEKDLLDGKEIDWSKYSGKTIYAIKKAVIDVLYPYSSVSEYGEAGNYYTAFLGIFGNFEIYYRRPVNFSDLPRNWVSGKFEKNQFWIYSGSISSSTTSGYYKIFCKYLDDPLIVGRYIDIRNDSRAKYFSYETKNASEFELAVYYTLLGGANVQNVPNMTAKTAAKVKLPTRLPQSVINNYNTYINGDSENLVIAPTADELPTLPDNYNPVTDDPPDLDGFQDVTPDQKPSDLPEPTPTPTPTPTPLPEDPTPNDFYQFLTTLASSITAFFTVIVNFLADLFAPPTETVNLGLLAEIPDTAFTKFPFSMPTDFKRILSVVQAKGECPDFTLTIPMSKINLGGDIDYHIELSQWETGAKVVRIALLISFCIGLLLITKKLIWGA